MSAKPETAHPPCRRFRLTSVRAVRRELAVVYAEARQNRLDWQSAARAASVLQILTRMIEGGEFEARLDRLEAALADRGHGQRRPNGGEYHAARL